MKIISWNVNGLRAVHRKDGFLDLIKRENPDMLCLQETKAHEEQLPEEIRNIEGYGAYFSSPKDRKGYSGVALYTKQVPEKVLIDDGIKELSQKGLDREGRIIAAFYSDFVLLNVYFPNGGGGPERIKYKLDFYDAFLDLVDRIRSSQDGANKKIVFCGDINTAHEEIDLARPKENETHTGFLPEERAWLDEVVAHGYVDVFRHFYPDKTSAYTYWDMKTRARDRNVGWRIDYFFASAEFIKSIKDITIRNDVYGSDHCPITINIK